MTKKVRGLLPMNLTASNFAPSGGNFEAEDEDEDSDNEEDEVGHKQKRKIGCDDIDSMRRTTAPSGTPAIKDQSGKYVLITYFLCLLNAYIIVPKREK